MSTIPASQLVQVLPNVLNAGGNGLVLNGIVLTQNTRVPIGQVVSFPNDGISVLDFFGASAKEVSIANTYFLGFNNSTQKPSSIFFSQYNSTAVPAWLQGGPVDQLTMAQLRALNGSLTVVMDGYTHTAASLSLAGATSFSAAAALIAAGLNATEQQAASVTGSIAADTVAFQGSIAGYILNVDDVTSGTLVPGAIVAGTGVTGGTQISSQLSGVTGGAGTYAVSISQTVADGALTASYGTLTVTAVTSGTISVGQVLSGAGVTAGTLVTALGTGEGLVGTYFVQTSQTVASEAITASAAPLTVVFDSVSGAFILTSGITGTPSTAAFATGTLAASLFLTSATGATVSQGAAASVPAAFMNNITQITQNWATFMTAFDPDGGSGSSQKQAFAAWVNTTNRRYAYIAWDSDITPTESLNATASFGNIVKAANMDGTCAIWEPTNQLIAAFICGSAASINFTATNGRITFAFKGQDGLIASVTNATQATNLIANGYNFYGVYATANQQFLEFQPGSVSGAFEWLDSYINQIWLNNALQLALMELAQNVNSIPYNAAGYALVAAACADPINNAINFGAINPGVPLSAAQAAEINTAAGTKVDDVLTLQGWYLQIIPAQPQVRQARQSPPINFWYMDGGSIQKIILNSVLVQ